MEADRNRARGQTLSTRYADLQIDITGGEGGVTPRLPARKSGRSRGTSGSRTARTPSRVRWGGAVRPFFPGELHSLGVARPEATKVRKAVVKIRMEDKA